MMNKAELIKMIESLPEDMFVEPLEFSECKAIEGQWLSENRIGNFGGVYRRDVDNVVTLRLNFKTQYEGEFRRTYENKDGMFRNVRRIS